MFNNMYVTALEKKNYHHIEHYPLLWDLLYQRRTDQSPSFAGPQSLPAGVQLLLPLIRSFQS